MRILIVDDNLMMRHVLNTQLNALGHQKVSKAVSCAEALSQIADSVHANDGFDLILLDWSMPEMNGLDFLKKCRGDKFFDQIAIVMVTAESEEESIMQAIEAGATSYLVKPLELNMLKEKLELVSDWLERVNPSRQSQAHV